MALAFILANPFQMHHVNALKKCVFFYVQTLNCRKEQSMVSSVQTI